MTRSATKDAGPLGPPAPQSAVRRTQTRVHALLSGTGDANLAARGIAIALSTLILLNVAAAVLETVNSVRLNWERAFEAFECFSVAVFSVEYLLRLWSCTVDPRYEHWLFGRLRYVASPLMLIDLISIATFYVASVMDVDLRTLRAIRLIRLIRVLKIARYSESLQLLGRVLYSRRSELVITLVAVSVLLVISSTLMYYAERDAQPAHFSSVPAAMWWSIETLTTIGYGDMIPQTATGKFINSLIALLGIGLFALPAGILGSGFVEELQRRRQTPVRCPKCGDVLVPIPVEPERGGRPS